MLLLDTDILIDIQRAHAPAVAWFASLVDLPVVPGFVVMELIQDARNTQQMRQALRLVAPLQVVWPTEADCNRALSDFTPYHLSHNVGLLDALIATCATGLAATLCTFNVKRYRIIPNLVILQPYIR
jgi:predicted nucleic acid-binding protein